MKILISARGKQKYVAVPDETHAVIAVLSVFFPPDTPIKLGQYTFLISEINPWPPAEPLEQVKFI